MTIKDKNLQWTITQTKNLISGSGFMTYLSLLIL